MTSEQAATSPGTPAHRISLIVPVWRESDALWEKCCLWAELPGVCEVIVVAAGELQGSRNVHPKVRVQRCQEANRGAQQKLGAEAATGDVFIFHHADTELRAEHIGSLLAAVTDPSCGGGAFVRAFDERHPGLKWLQRLAAWQQERWGALYGDQSIFMRAEVYHRIGGFPPIPLMEDVEVSKRLRRATRIAMLRPPLATSARRHRKHGSWRSSARNGILLLLHRIGVSPFRLHRWYYHDLDRRSLTSLIWRELICQREPPKHPDPARPS